jgi:uncharacterized protein (DUF2062 family)
LRTRWFKRPRRAAAKTLPQRLGRLAKLIYTRVVRVNASPSQVAAGAAVGVWLGVFPTFGLAAPVGYALAWAFRFNKAAAVAGAAIMNPLTSPLFWAASAALGAALTGDDWRRVYGALRHERYLFAFSRTTLAYAAGNVVIATATAAVAFILVYFGVRRRLARRRARRPS